MTSTSPPPHDRIASADARGATAAVVALAMLGIAAYSNSLHGALLLDDAASITDNESIRSLWPMWPVLRGASPTTVGRPVVNLSFALGYALGGIDLVRLHAVNVAVHVLAALTLFGVARRTLASPRLPERFARSATGLAFAVAAIWTVHPLQTEAVTYVCQRAESLAGFFCLATLYCAIRATQSHRSFPWQAAAVAACAMGMATKETAASAPLIVLLHDRTFHSGSFRGALRARRGFYAWLAATWVLLAVLVALSDGRGGGAGFGRGMSAAQYAATQPRAIVEYLRLCVWPHPLVFDRGADVASTAVEIVPYAVAVAWLVAASAWALVRRPPLGFLGAWFFAILAPSSSFVPLVVQTAAEHRMYLPLAAVAALGVVAAHEGARRTWGADAGGRACAAALCVVVLGLGMLTRARNETYSSPQTMWEDVVAHEPLSVRAHVNLGLALARDGEFDGAVERLDVAVALDPDNAYTRLVRGNLLHEAGRADEAIADYTAAAASAERAPTALTSRAIVLQEQGRTDLAMRDLDAAIALAPDRGAAYHARAVTHLFRREFELAWADVAAARKLGRPPSEEFVARLTRESGRSQ